MTTPSEHTSKIPLCGVSHGVWWVVVGLALVAVLALAVYLIGLWLLVFGLLRKVAACVVVAVSIAAVGCLAWHQRRRFFTKPQFSLRSLLLLPALCALGLWIVYSLPRSQPLSYDSSCVGYYRGLGLKEEPGFTGKNWYRILGGNHAKGHYVKHSLDGHWEVDIDGVGYNQYRSYYESGALRAEGLCMVVKDGTEFRAHNRSDLQQGRFYDPSGKLISEIKDGVGKQVLCFSNGQRFLEAAFVDGKWSGPVRIWYRGGRLCYEGYCRNGMDDGPFKSYYANGVLQYQGAYKDGKPAGVWVRYADNGNVTSQTDYDSPVDAEPTDEREPE
jgi:antitoxin component YwqK of YwqJK toxin-antitoxin module